MSQGDEFRRALKYPYRVALSNYKIMLVDGAMDFGMSRVEATGLFEHLSISSRNTFANSHAVSFALIACQTDWLTANM